MKTLIILLLAFVFLASILLDKAVHTFSLKELKRRARSKDKEAARVYKLASHRDSLSLFLWLVGGISGTLLFFEAAYYSLILAIVFVLLISWLVLAERSLNYGKGLLWRVAAALAGPTNSLVDFLHPPLARISNWLSSLKTVHIHTGIYDKEDLLELINNQNNQVDNRIPEGDLHMAFGALTFGDKTVASVMTPRRAVKMVASSDTIGPLLMDELHASGFSRFPVVKNSDKKSNPEIIGTLYLKDLIGYKDKGKVKDLMKKNVYFINEAQTLREALAAFLKTQHHLLVVVNNFEEISGVITIEDALEQIIGGEIVDEFDRYDDMRQVASLEAKKEHKLHSEPKVVE